MTAALPTVGGDSGAWGAELNAYLQVSHNADGTQKYGYNVVDFGADPTGVADSTAAFQACVNAITGTTSPATTTRTAKGPMDVPAGTYKLTTDVIIRSTYNFRIRAAGSGQVRLVPSGSGFARAVILVDGSLDGVFEGFSIQGDGTEQVTNAICLDWTASRADASSGTTSGSATVTDTHAVASDVGAVVSGTGIPAATYITAVSAGVSFTMSANATATGSVTVTVGGAARSTTGNCFRDIRILGTKFVVGISLESNSTRQLDGTTLQNVVITGGQTPGSWSTSGNWQKGIALGDSTFSNIYDTRAFGVDVALCYYGWYCNASGFSLLGSQPAGNAIDFFVIPGAQTTIANIQSQNSGQFLVQTSTFNPNPISVSDVYMVTTNAPSSKFLIDIYGGNFHIKNFVADVIVAAAYVDSYIKVRGAAANRPGVVILENITLHTAFTSAIIPTAGQASIVVINYSQYDPATGAYTVTRLQLYNGTSWITPAEVISPVSYGALGDGTTDDTTAMLAAFSAAQTVNRIVDLGTKTYLTSSAIPAYTGMRLRGTNQQGFVSSSGGTIVNNTSDLFSFTGAVTDIKISDCTLKASAGHVFSAGTATIALLKIDGTVISQTATGKSIWNQTGGGLLDSVIGDNCSFYMNPLATVSPWVVTGVVGNFNSVTFRKLRCTMNGNGAVVPFFKIDPGSTAGWNEEIKFQDITWEICSGGAIAMTAAVGVTVDNCANWDIPSVRSDTGCSTNTTTTVTDAAAVNGDLNKTISGTGIPAGTRITAVTAGTGYTISQAATATASGLTFIVGGLSTDFYSFKTSTAGYPVRSIQILGGRAGSGSTTGSGHNDFFADSSCTNIHLRSFGSWGTPPVISSPTGQTTVINGTVASGSPTNTIPGLVASQDPLNIGVPINFFPTTLPIAASVVVANDGWYSKLVSGGYAISNIVVDVAASSGNISVATYTNAGTGMSATPTGGRLATSGAIACPAIGLATVSLGATVTPALGDWFGISADNTTATFYRQDSGVTLGYLNLPGWGMVQTSAHPLPSTPSTLGTSASSGNFIMRGA